MTIHRLEPAKQFVTRVMLLNRFHAPDEEDYSEATHKLGALHRGFPNGLVHEQAAYLVAGILAAEPFQEANFRTAMDYVSDTLSHEGYELQANLREQQDLGIQAWTLREESEGACRRFLEDWFKPRILHVGRQT